MLRGFLRQDLPLWLVLAIMGTLAFGGFLFWKLGWFGHNYELNLPFQKEAEINFDYGPQPALARADVFNQVKGQLIDERADFVEANLSTMDLTVYESGGPVFKAKILTKGKEGSWWETPAGIYKIESKEKNHFSSFGQVYQPWSMAFQGNFFIHGWPYYPGGQPVSSTYSGGCIRLSTEDAEKIFNLVKVGTPVLIFERDFSPDDFQYKIEAPTVSARSYLVADLRNNYVLFEKSSSEVVPVASIVKLVTALVAAEYINLDKTITITSQMIVPTSLPRLKAGQRISAYQLLYPLLDESSNEAAIAFANTLGEERFVKLMNKKAASLGMANTKFVDAAGSGSENLSTAEDLFNLAKYLYNNRSFVLRISAGKITDSAYGPPPFSDLGNFNLFSKDPDFVGGKIGKSGAAKETMLAVFELDIRGVKRPIAIIVLGSEGKVEEDVSKILNWIKQNYGSYGAL